MLQVMLEIHRLGAVNAFVISILWAFTRVYKIRLIMTPL